MNRAQGSGNVKLVRECVFAVNEKFNCMELNAVGEPVVAMAAVTLHCLLGKCMYVVAATKLPRLRSLV